MFGNNKRRSHFNYGNSGQMMYDIPLDLGMNTGFIRNQPYPYVAPIQNYNWPTYQPQNPYYPVGYSPSNQVYPQGYMQQQLPHVNQAYPQKKDSQFLFQNPLQPQEELYSNQYQPMNGYPNMNPYPKQSIMQKQPGGMQSFMNSFKSQDGSVDFNKMVNTAGQMMTAVNQVSSLVKGIGGFFKA